MPEKDTDKLTCQMGERRSCVSFNLEESDTAELQGVQGRQRGRPVGSSHSLATSKIIGLGTSSTQSHAESST